MPAGLSQLAGVRITASACRRSRRKMDHIGDVTDMIGIGSGCRIRTDVLQVMSPARWTASLIRKNGQGDTIRTRDPRNPNPMLYQLSYALTAAYAGRGVLGRAHQRISRVAAPPPGNRLMLPENMVGVPKRKNPPFRAGANLVDRSSCDHAVTDRGIGGTGEELLLSFFRTIGCAKFCNNPACQTMCASPYFPATYAMR